MSDFVESEAEESEEEYDEEGTVVPKKPKKFLEDDDEEEEEEDENADDQDEQGNLKDFINDDVEDDEEEEEEEDAGSQGSGGSDSIAKKRKRKTYDDRLEDDDFDLIEENLGVKVKRQQKFRRVKKVSDDEDEEEEETAKKGHEKEAIADELFPEYEGEEGEQVEVPVVAPEEEEEEEDEESDIDDFIVDDDGQPLKKPKWKRKFPGYTDAALQEAQEIFGVDFDYDEFEKYNEYDEEMEEEYEFEDEELGEGETRVRPKKTAKKRVSRRSIFEIYEPSELESSHLTDQDNEIRVTDMPERFQLRGIPVKPCEDDELEEESEWIYRNAFSTPSISLQESSEYLERGQGISNFSRKGPATIQKIKEALNFMRNQHFEVPFIAFYRKEYVDPELNINDLWKLWQWDEKWTQLKTRKENLNRLFQKMQAYQYEQISADPDKPLADGVRALDTADLERLKDVQSNDELQDVYNHFLLYYGRDIPKMQNALKPSKKKYKKSQQVGEDEEEGERDEEVEDDERHGPELKQASRRDMYTICQK